MFQVWSTMSLTSAIIPIAKRFIAVGGGGAGVIRNSEDATSWSTSSTGVTTTLTDVAGDGKGVAVAVGYSGKILRSTDGGVTWTIIPTPAQITGSVQHIMGVVWVKDRFFISSRSTTSAGTLMSSPDGITWTSVPVSGIHSNINFGIAVSGDTILVPGAAGAQAFIVYKLGNSSASVIINQASSDTYYSNICAIATPSLWIIGGQGGKITTAPLANPASTTLRRGQQNNDGIYGLVYDQELNIHIGAGVVAADNSPLVITSVDALTWSTKAAATMKTVFGNTVSWMAPRIVNGKRFMCTSSGLYSTTDWNTFTKVTGAGTELLRTISYV